MDWTMYLELAWNVEVSPKSCECEVVDLEEERTEEGRWVIGIYAPSSHRPFHM
jgi:hypothetical protein